MVFALGVEGEGAGGTVDITVDSPLSSGVVMFAWLTIVGGWGSGGCQDFWHALDLPEQIESI